MSENKSIRRTGNRIPERSRVMPLLFAGGFCFVVAVFLGYGSWKVFGTPAREQGVSASLLQSLGIGGRKTPKTKTEVTTTPRQPLLTEPFFDLETKDKISLEPQGVASVSGGETAFGGGNSKRPLQRVFISNFHIGETEVTNSEYEAFVESTGYKAPSYWKNNRAPVGTGNFPVVEVSVSDAVAFCNWKSKELGLEVRLPTYGEWQRAAAGENRFKYPWGNQWNDAAISGEKQKRPFPVKSFALNRSPYGAFDMLGNVWEWTAEPLKQSELISKAAIDRYSSKSRIHLVLGGSFNEDRDKLANSFWAEIEAETRVKSVGFRYVIILDSPQKEK